MTSPPRRKILAAIIKIFANGINNMNIVNYINNMSHINHALGN
jgi:hypothetical protein